MLIAGKIMGEENGPAHAPSADLPQSLKVTSFDVYLSDDYLCFVG